MKSLKLVITSILAVSMVFFSCDNDEKDTFPNYSFENDEIILWEGEWAIADFFATLSPEQAAILAQAEWTSSNPNVLEVSGDKITVKSPGTSEVTVKRDGKHAVLSVVVPLAGMNTFSRSEASIHLIGTGTATIDWGDGTAPETVTVSGGNGTFCRHDYAGNTVNRRILITGGAGVTQLGCNNIQLTGEFRISTNPKLEYLGFYVGDVSSLKTGVCPVLRTIECNNNALTELNVSKCAALENLWCATNRMTIEALRSLITSLPVYPTSTDASSLKGTIDISGNTGATPNLRGEAEAKGWRLICE